MNWKWILMVAVSFCSCFVANGQKQSIFFIENKNQWNTAVKYKANLPGGAVFITDAGFTYSFYNTEDVEKVHEKMESKSSNDKENYIVQMHAYRINFSGANKTGINYTTENKRTEYYNFFLGSDPSKWAGKVAAYETLIQHNVYQGIDMKVYNEGDAMKYDFIVAPGSDPSQIALNFEGIRPELTSTGSLKIKTSVNEVTEGAPVSYQLINGNRKTVRSKYRLQEDGNIVFEFPEGYDKKYELVIDPTLVFSTYNGSNSSSFGYTASYDTAGALFTGVLILDPSGGWPATVGAFQTTVGGGLDAGINKFSPDGSTLVFSTYFGGSDREKVNAMICNSQNELIITGITYSDNLPVTAGAFQGSCNGSFFCFATYVARFSIDGASLLGSTYISGAGTEGGNWFSDYDPSRCDVICDSNDNIFVATTAFSNSFQTTANAPQPFLGGIGNNGVDGAVFQLNPNCSQLLFGTFLGGAEADACFSLVLNTQGNIVACGGTKSNDFPVTAGSMLSAPPGNPGTNNTNGFVSVINPNTGALISSTYLGTTEPDVAFKVQTDLGDSIVVLGITKGAYPVTQGLFNIPNGDMFLDKLAPNLSTSIRSTRLGRIQQMYSAFEPTAFLYRPCNGKTYIAGCSADAQMPVTPNAYQSTPAQFYICTLNEGWTTLEYATFWGDGNDDHVDAHNHRFDPKGTLYQGVCSSLGYPTTPNAYATTPLFAGSGYENGGFKFEFEESNANALVNVKANSDDTGCAPFTVHFENNSLEAADYYWDFKDGSSSSDTEPTHTFTGSGIYNVMLIAQSACEGLPDTAYIPIYVREADIPSISLNDTIVCRDIQYVTVNASVGNVGAGANVQYSWQPINAVISGANSAAATVDISAVQEFTVNVSLIGGNGLCPSQNSDTIRIFKSEYMPVRILMPDTTLCYGDSIRLTAEGSDAYTYSWYPISGLTGSNTKEPVAVVFQPTVYILTGTDSLGCSLNDSVRIDVTFCCQLSVPNAFSPNGDALNDAFSEL